MNRHVLKTLAFSFVTLAVGGALVVPLYSQADPAPEEWKAPSRAARKKNPIPADAQSIAAGKVVYAAQCYSCHGPAGHGDGPAAKDLNPKPRNLSDPAIQSQTDGSIFWKLTEGKKPMPTFEKLIPENDRWHVINYVRTLAAPGGK
jgi:mono/diheme cytochrome c family protein